MKRGPQNPERTRRALLAAATEEFARNGLRGARIVQIAQRAGANVQAIYYHFGNKEDLYRAAIDSLYDAESFDEVCKALDTLDPAAAIHEVIRFMFEGYSKDSLHYALLTEQDMHGAQQLRTLTRVQALFRVLIDKLQQALDRGAASGVFRPGLDAARVFLSITGLTGSYIHKAQTSSALMGRDFDSPEEVDAWREYMVGLIFAGLAPWRPS